jgi:AcrR family transcriptional regulator
MVRPLATAINLRLKPHRQPSRVAHHLDGPYRFDCDDDLLSRVFQATLEQVGLRGFDGATTVRIARAAGVSEGVIFNRYRTKLHLFLDASRRSVASGAARNEEFMADLEKKFGPGMAEAVMLRELMRPGRELQRSINLEQQRLVRHHSELRQSVDEQYRQLVEAVRGTSPRWSTNALRAHVHVALAMGLGAALLAQLYPQAWHLPFDVITEAAV